MFLCNGDEAWIYTHGLVLFLNNNLVKVTVTAHNMRHEQACAWAVTVTWVRLQRNNPIVQEQRKCDKAMRVYSTCCW